MKNAKSHVQLTQIIIQSLAPNEHNHINTLTKSKRNNKATTPYCKRKENNLHRKR